MTALHKCHSNISANSREIEDPNIEKSLSLIIARLVSMATKQNRWFEFLEKVLPLSYNWSAPTVNKSGRSDQYCDLYIVWRQNSHKTLGGFHGNKQKPLIRFSWKSFAIVPQLERTDCKEIRRIGSVLWPVHRLKTEFTQNTGWFPWQ